MTKKPKFIAAALLATATVKAKAEAILVPAPELRQYEQQKGFPGLERRLLEMGILVQTGQAGVYVLEDSSLSEISDPQLVQVISDLVVWLTGGRIKPCEKTPCTMNRGSQDYHPK